ncbi:MAG: O-antigen ligase family protein [Oscillospiraceae bacterium]|nr:O-antigen ligase family protein [Oscillospiraceae bacterium]
MDPVFENSLILGLIVRFWNAVCEAFKNSLFCRLCRWIADVYRSSALCRLLSSEGLEALWKRSLLYRALEWLFNLIPRALRRLFGEGRPCADSSLFFTKVAPRFDMLSLALMCVLIAFMLSCPYKRWNNFYALVIALAALCCLWIRFIRGGKLSFEHAGAWTAIFLIIYMLSAVWSQSFETSWRYVFYSFTAALVILICVNSVTNLRRLYALIVFCALGLAVCSLYGVLQGIRGVEASASYTDLSVNSDMPGRVFSFFDNPNTFASIMVFFAPMMLAMVFYGRGWKKRTLFAIAFLASTAALVMTYSRGAWLAYAFALFVLALMLCPRWVPLFIVGCVAMLPFLPQTIQNRLLSIFSSDSSIGSRSYIYSAVIRLLKRNWFFGVGLGSTELRRGVAVFNTFDTVASHFYFVHAHNIFLEVWAESGILALIAFAGSMLSSLKRGVRAVKTAQSREVKGAAAGAAAGLFGALMFGMTDNLWAYPRVLIIFWFLVGILYSAAKLAGEKNGKAE